MPPETWQADSDKAYKINVDDMPWQPYGRGRFVSEHRFVDLHIRQRKIGLIVSRLAPSSASCPFHFHHVSEELFYVLEGTGTLRYGPGTVPVRPGDVISCPPGPEGAHQLTNAGDRPLIYLAVSTEDFDAEVCEYPDTGKVRAWVPIPGGAFGRYAYHGLFGKDETVDYCEGELEEPAPAR